MGKMLFELSEISKASDIFDGKIRRIRLSKLQYASTEQFWSV
jgi:hypothetical protein